MELFASAINLANDKPWATGVAKNALARVNDVMFPVPAEFRFNVSICFAHETDARPRLVAGKPDGEWRPISIFFPVANWIDRHSSRPLAESAIASCLFDAASEIGVNPDLILRYADEAGIDINVAHTAATREIEDDRKLTIPYSAANQLFSSSLDERGPLGNDTGADVHELYRNWRIGHEDRSAFLDMILERWKIHCPTMDEITEAVLAERSNDILTYDDAVIALAFSQYFVDGSVEDHVRDQCLAAIERQSTPIVIQHRGWSSPTERLDALAAMRAFIEQADG